MKKERLFSLTKKDFDIQTFRSGGAGGQNQNKRDTGVRIVHRESGAVGESRTHRTQLQNKHEAFRRLSKSPILNKWIKIRAAEITGAVESAVDDAMRPHNLKIEYFE